MVTVIALACWRGHVGCSLTENGACLESECECETFGIGYCSSCPPVVQR